MGTVWGPFVTVTLLPHFPGRSGELRSPIVSPLIFCLWETVIICTSRGKAKMWCLLLRAAFGGRSAFPSKPSHAPAFSVAAPRTTGCLWHQRQEGVCVPSPVNGGEAHGLRHLRCHGPGQGMTFVSGVLGAQGAGEIISSPCQPRNASMPLAVSWVHEGKDTSVRKGKGSLSPRPPRPRSHAVHNPRLCFLRRCPASPFRGLRPLPISATPRWEPTAVVPDTDGQPPRRRGFGPQGRRAEAARGRVGG